MVIYIEFLHVVSCSDDEQPKPKPRSSLLSDIPQLIPAEDDVSFKSETTLVVSWCIIIAKSIVYA